MISARHRDVLALPIFKQEDTSLSVETETKNPPFQYVLCASTSPAVKLHDEILTYLNQADQVNWQRSRQERPQARTESAPDCSKTVRTSSVVWSVPKVARPKELNHFRPFALTSHLMKTLERIILHHLRPLVSSPLDPLQFAYRPGIGPALLRAKLEGAGVDRHLTTWTTDYLTNRPQFVRLHDCVSDVVTCSTGAPQGMVLSPFLFTLYTSDLCHNTSNCYIQKFSDDTAIVGSIFYAVVCWGGGCMDRDRRRLDKLIRRASSVLDSPLDSVEEVGEKRMLSKLASIMDNTSHPLRESVVALSSSFNIPMSVGITNPKTSPSQLNGVEFLWGLSKWTSIFVQMRLESIIEEAAEHELKKSSKRTLPADCGDSPAKRSSVRTPPLLHLPGFSTCNRVNSSSPNHQGEVTGHIAMEQLSPAASLQEPQQWLHKNRFATYTQLFSHFSGSDLLKLTRDDLVQICGPADGIRLFNALKSRSVRPRLTVYLCQESLQSQSPTPLEGSCDSKNGEHCNSAIYVYHALYLEEMTASELTSKIASIINIPVAQINQVFRQGPSGIHILLSDQVMADPAS
ncbi:upstream-binding protein 1-like [Megalops cyprinoides]|uniref:upstream-binding protein 1-like n=1 Tax=Megalops cyprinoides TaxID=118141 RepID=UPI0018642A16|nr:upstream-binding protein 1-like [Megalops cyprinoides]